MRETIKSLLKYINEECEVGRDDMQIAVLYSAVSAIYSALEAIKEVENKRCDDCPYFPDCEDCMYNCEDCIEEVDGCHADPVA